MAYNWEIRAQLELGETPDKKRNGLRNLRALIEGMNDPTFVPRTDDQFLVRFLRVRKYDVRKAFRTYKRYFKIRLYDPTRYMQVGARLSDYTHELEHQAGTILQKRNPIDGSCVLIWRMGTLDPDNMQRDFGDLVTPTVICLDHVFRADDVQVNGLRVISDFHKIDKDMYKLLPISLIKVIIYAVHDAYPARFKGFHIVNNTPFFTVTYKLIRNSLTKKLLDRFHIHGSDMSTLHQYIDKSILPEEYGGLDGKLDNSWLVKEVLARDDEVEHLSHFGWGVKGAAPIKKW